MQNRIDVLMGLSTFELQKRAVASLIAVIEDNDIVCELVKEAIEALPEAQKQLNEAAKYDNDTCDDCEYDGECDCGYCECEDDCNECECEDECDCIGGECPCFHEEIDSDTPVFVVCPHAKCLCEDECEECPCEEMECTGTECPSYSIPCEVDEENSKPPFCRCEDECDECGHQEKSCIGLDCPHCKNPRECYDE